MKRAPAYLKKPGRVFWNKTLKIFELEDPQDLQRLEQACHCLDRIAEARKEVEAKGPYFEDRFGQPKENPAQKTERDNKILFARLIRELCLDIEPPDPRPPRKY